MRIGLIVGLILLGAAGRVIPHPDNFTPLMAVALFGGATLSTRWAYAVPLVALAASDLLLGQAFDTMSAVVYACFVASVGLGHWLGRHRTWMRTGVAALGASLLFYLVTNFAGWLLPHGLYPHTLQGLLQTYVMAIPFFGNSVGGDLFWTALLFALYDAGRASARALRPSTRHLAS